MVSIIVCSYDGYSDCWDIFFTLLRKNFPESEKFDIILSTTTKHYEFSGLKIRTLAHGKNTPWSKRLKLSLKEAKYDIVLPLTEDFFLLSKVDYILFSKLTDLIKNNLEIDHIRLLFNIGKYEVKPSAYELLEEIGFFTKNRFLFLPGLWKKNILTLYLKDFENIYLAEKMGNYRSYIRRDGLYTISSSIIKKRGHVYRTYGSGAIYKGKWNKWVVQFCKKNDINIDFEKRGLVTAQYQKEERINTKINLLKQPILLLRSSLSILMLFIKNTLSVRL